MAHCKDVEEFNRILECPICIERIREPRILPCLHSFCERCIGQHMDGKQKNGSFPCPMCNTEFQVPQNGATGFKRNMYLETIGDLFPEVSDVKCELCELRDLDSPASSMCINCQECLCQRCAQNHCYTKSSLNHKVVSLEEIRSGRYVDEIRRSQRIHCNCHPEEVLKIYCEKCMKPLCLLCAMLDHKEHEMKNVEKAANDADDVMRKLLDSWKTAADHSVAMSAECKKVLDNLDQKEVQLVNDVELTFSEFKDEIIQEVDFKKTQSIGQLKDQIAAARKQAKIAYNEANTAEISLNGTLKYVQNILDSAQNVEKLQQFQDIKVRLEKLDMQTLTTEVISPIFNLHKHLKIPNSSMNVSTGVEKHQISFSSLKPVRTRIKKEKTVLTQRFGTLLTREKPWSFSLENEGKDADDDHCDVNVHDDITDVLMMKRKKKKNKK